MQVLESLITDQICHAKQQICELEKTIEYGYKKLRQLEKQKHHRLETAFQMQHGRSAADVRNEYIELLTEHSGPASSGHYVKVNGFDYHQKNSASHCLLLPEHYERCKPSKLVTDAFATIGETVWIEPEPHQVYWGN